MAEYVTFYGKNVNEALAKMKLQLGMDARVLSQEEVKVGGFFGLFSKPMVKIVAIKPEKKLFSKNNFLIRKGELTSVAASGRSKEIELEKELQEIKSQLAKLVTNKTNTIVEEKNNSNSITDKLLKKYENLMRENDFGEDIIKKILKNIEKNINLEEIDDEKIIIDNIKDQLKELITIRRDSDIIGTGVTPKVLFFVGPTGVGKTTTLVKLAANYKLKEKKSVEIYTIDNYRVGAVEQLKAYAEIMDTKFAKVDNKIELKNIIKESEADLILIDTAGRSPKDDISISTLREFIKTLNVFNVDVFLVISASTKRKDIVKIAEKYSETKFDYLIYTKMDETESTGAIIDATYRIKKPITFVTYGQDVPKDISIANLDLLVDFAIKE